MDRLFKRAFCILLTILFVQPCIGCDTDYGNRTVVQDINKYMLVDNYVIEKLSDAYVGILPSNDVLEYDGAKYYYSYNQPLLDNPSFVIYLNNTITDPTTFIKEKERVVGLPNSSVAESDLRTLCFVGNLERAIESYTDDEVRDGLCIRLELAIIDEETKSIEYLVASQQDQTERTDIILNVLRDAGSILSGDRTGDQGRRDSTD